MTQELTVIYEPQDAYGEIKWKSSNEKIAKVDENGLVTAVGNGKATITARTTNGKGNTIKAECTVYVSVPTQTIVLDTEKLTLVYDAGRTSQRTKTIKVTEIIPYNVKTPTEWTVEGDAGVVSIKANSNGKSVIVTPLKEGECTITATNAGISASCSVIVAQAKIDEKQVGATRYSVSNPIDGSTSDKVVVFFAGYGSSQIAIDKYRFENPKCTVIVVKSELYSNDAKEVWSNQKIDEICSVIEECQKEGYNIEIIGHSQGGYAAVEAAKQLDLDSNDKVILADATMHYGIEDYKAILDKGTELTTYLAEGTKNAKEGETGYNLKNNTNNVKENLGGYENYTYKEIKGESHGTVIKGVLEEEVGEYYSNKTD